ncbi:hypothetical protein N7462_000989 [Penicillium macrosclerotiorum]|uniref:uncharacterized protein n=1 Tax=Penicillium macrosclerotiorum TaxID=303699 RepID=UPI002548C4F0|nr:uncharacterized protein N7462_000989 [Penicillium macrosclerotiorum]KAJ5698984.1 hypothetical protein N7462_000989 [Penicillium macrosclerotiorum]
MFYSHEILTSPEHGVATIWLVATLGSRSIARRLNRKTIQDVDVPGACRVIINPEAPMALRLQGSLLYGVSRVYDQQCGYTLLDAQTTHDKMNSMLKLIPGGGLDPNAGKVKPASLILPYDPTFLPETGLPGIDLNLTIFDIHIDDNSSLQSSVWTNSPTTSQSSLSQIGKLHLDLPSDEFLRDGDVQSPGIEINTASKKRGLFGGETQADFEDSGVLFDPDFRFDEDGNIVEFDDSRLSPRKRRKFKANLQGSEGPKTEQTRDDELLDPADEAVLIPGDESTEVNTLRPPLLQEQSALPGLDRLLEEGEVDRAEARAQHKAKQVKVIKPDGTTTLRNAELARWNDDYLTNMARSQKQKQQNKQISLAKKNAASWVFGLGIGSVGKGIGTHHELHPLKLYSGKDLYNAVCGRTEKSRQKRKRDDGDESMMDEQESRSRARSQQPEMLDVELGRQAPSSAYDDRSSQMPWNITASIQGSVGGQRFGSVSESSVRGHGESAGLLGTRTRGRLTSASPLAGRGYLDGHERPSSLSIPGNMVDDLDDLEQLDITQYLEGELEHDHADISTLPARRKSTFDRITATLDQESVNFLEFIKARMQDSMTDVSGQLSLSTLLPPAKTTRTVAAHGFMNVLTLATKGILTLSQAPGLDRGADSWGIRYEHGEVSLGLVGM